MLRFCIKFVSLTTRQKSLFWKNDYYNLSINQCELRRAGLNCCYKYGNTTERFTGSITAVFRQNGLQSHEKPVEPQNDKQSQTYMESVTMVRILS